MNKQQRTTELAILALAGMGLLLVAGVAAPPFQVTACRGNALEDCLLYINPQGKPIPNSFAGDFTVKGELMAGELMVDGEIMAGEAMVNGEITAGELMVRGEITAMDLMVQDTLMVGMGTVTIMEDSIDWGPGANDDLTAADVTDLTDGGETNLHTHAEGAHNHDAAYLNDDQQEFMSANPGSFSAVFNVSHTGTGPGIHGISVSAEDVGLYAWTPNGYSVWAVANGPFSRAVYASSTEGTGVWGEGGKYGVYGNGSKIGVYGYSAASDGSGVAGLGEQYGVAGSSWQGVGVDAFNFGSGGVPLRVRTVQSVNLIEGYTDFALKGPSLVFRVSRGGTVYADGKYYCGAPIGCFNAGQGADIAERIEVSESLEPGDVVEIDSNHPGQFRKASSPYSTLVAGIISTSPGMTLGNDFNGESEDWEDDRPLLALVGTVPVKVSAENGAIQPGDLLTSELTEGVNSAATVSDGNI